MPGKIGSWRAFHEKILASKKRLLVVYYEEIVSDPISSVRKMVEFLPNPLLHPKDLEDRLACLSQEISGLAKRKSRNFTFDLYPPEVRKIINKGIGEMRMKLQDAGIEQELPPYEIGPDFAW